MPLTFRTLKKGINNTLAFLALARIESGEAHVKREEAPEVFRGHLDECLAHFSQEFQKKYPKGSRKTQQGKQPIAFFCGVSIATVTRWLYHGEHPAGVEHFKLLCYLDMSGYRLIELERLNKTRRNILEMIAFSVVSIEEACSQLGYSSTSTLSAVLRNQVNPSREMEAKMWELWKQRKEELETKKNEAQFAYGEGVEPDEKVSTPEPEAKAVERPSPLTKRQVALLKLMEGLLGLLDEEFFEQLPDESLSTALQLSARLSGLTSQHLRSDHDGSGK